ncbi:MAG: glycosyltransferase family 2 protein [Lentisphaerota bacterium]
MNTKAATENTAGKICVIVPAYCEERKIGEVVRAILQQCPDVVVVDDGSPDQTSAKAREAGAVVIRHEVNQGKGAALNTGFKHARAHGFEAVITMDADGQHAPAEIPEFIEAYRRTGIPVLVGNRMVDVKGMPPVRKWTNQFMSWLLGCLMKQYVPDTQCGYRLYRCDVIPLVSAESQRFAAESESLLHLANRGVRIGSVRIATIYGDEQSKINPVSDTIRFLSMLLKYYRKRHQRHPMIPTP